MTSLSDATAQKFCVEQRRKKRSLIFLRTQTPERLPLVRQGPKDSLVITNRRSQSNFMSASFREILSVEESGRDPTGERKRMQKLFRLSEQQKYGL